MTPPLGIIGAGRQGSALARLAVSAGLEVVLGNARGPATLAELVAELGPSARAAPVEEIATAAETVVVAAPLHALRQLPAAVLAGRVVLDATNYYRDWNGPIEELDAGTVTSSRLVQRHLAGSVVVKAFNTIDFRRLGRLARPAGNPQRSALPVAGDQDRALDRAVRLLDRLGYDAVVIGGLDASGCLEPGSPAYGTPYRGPEPATGDRSTWFAESPGVPVPVARLRALVGEAGRPDDPGAALGSTRRTEYP